MEENDHLPICSRVSSHYWRLHGLSLSQPRAVTFLAVLVILALDIGTKSFDGELSLVSQFWFSTAETVGFKNVGIRANRVGFGLEKP